MKKLLCILVLALGALMLNAQTKTSIKVTDLRKPISEYVAKNLPGYKTTEAYKVDTKGVITYEVAAMKGKDHQVLTFDKNGKFMKKVSKEMKKEEKKEMKKEKTPVMKKTKKTGVAPK